MPKAVTFVRDGSCRWPGCSMSGVTPGRLLCFNHWMKLPQAMRDAWWQEREKGIGLSTMTGKLLSWVSVNGGADA